VPSGAELWYDDRNIPALKEDVLNAAEVQAKQASSIRQLLDAGYEPDSVVDAIVSGDFKRLSHSGLYSVQLQPPQPEGPPEPPEPPEVEPDADEEVETPEEETPAGRDREWRSLLRASMERETPAPVNNVTVNVPEQPPAVVNVEGTTVTVEPAVVNVTTPEVTFNAPDITNEITVEPTPVTVEPTPVEINLTVAGVPEIGEVEEAPVEVSTDA
jgi:hypothetical protein